MEFKYEIANMLLEIEAVSIRDTSNLFTWVSGIKSPIYCDNRLTISFPHIRDRIAEGIKMSILEKYPDVEVIAGTATAGIPHAAWVAQKMNLPMVYVRSSNKAHGKENLIEGYLPEGKKVVLIEDLLSTGKSSMHAVKALQNAGAVVLGVQGIFSYNFKKLDELFKDQGVKYSTLTDYNTLLTVAVEKGYVKIEEIEMLKKWSEDPYIFTTNL